MTKKFTPTKEQLEKLAKVAKKKFFYLAGIDHTFIEISAEGMKISLMWQPHKDRDQIAMVIEGLTEFNATVYDSKIYNLYIDNDKELNPIVFAQKIHPSISCEKLLEVIG